ncbi:putative serine carboxypeptidase-like 52 [Cicer arietinum]|uniref:putative serine carboxypeptidase-like 52 n=1 Tax=Cicer arietinum TaxID=3827 RepID=UPI003CC66CDF
MLNWRTNYDLKKSKKVSDSVGLLEPKEADVDKPEEHIKSEDTSKSEEDDKSLENEYDQVRSRQYKSEARPGLNKKKGYRSLIYSGDHDLVVPFISTQAWIRALNYSIVDDWRPWFVNGQVGGYTRTYSNQMTFATVKGSGHTAPEYTPEQCFLMFTRWISYLPL